MILVNNKPVSSLEDTNKSKAWYEAELRKVNSIREPLVIKRRVMFRLGADGKRKKPPILSIQLRATVRSERGLEMWAYCETYKEKSPGNLELKPNAMRFGPVQTFHPNTDPELIFFLTRCANLEAHGLYIENLEAEATELNRDEMLSLEVQYNIMKLMPLEDVRYFAKSWGITNADGMTENQLRRALKTAVDASEKNKLSTKRGYSEFMGEIERENPELTEARAVVNVAFAKNFLSYDKMSRKVKHVLSGEHVALVPIESKDRVNDYIAELMLTKKMADVYDTLKTDTLGQKEVNGITVALIQQTEDRRELEAFAEKLEYVMPPKIGDDKLKERLIEKVQNG